MYWQAWSGRLRKELDLETEPVAVSFEGTAAAGEPPVAGRASVCQALRRASHGETVTISAETCGCPGGLVSLGLGQLPPEAKERLVDFLVGKEKVYASRAALHRSQGIVPPPFGMARAVVFAPLASACLRPDLVLFLGPPGSLHRLAGILHALDHGAGGAREERPEAAERRVEELGRVEAA